MAQLDSLLPFLLAVSAILLVSAYAARRKKSFLTDIRGPEATSFWLGLCYVNSRCSNAYC